MGTTLNREAFSKLIDENIEWLKTNTTRSLERDHILHFLDWSVNAFYPATGMVTKIKDGRVSFVSEQCDHAQTIANLEARLATAVEGHGIYVASRASVPERGIMWRELRSQGVEITSSWIDEDGAGQTADFSELWSRIVQEVAEAERLVLYAEATDFPLKGALIEVGVALGLGKPITVCLPGVELAPRSLRPIGSWINHPLVERNDNVKDAVGLNGYDKAQEILKELGVEGV